MKLALITDLHANREAVAAVLAHAQAQGVGQIAFLGDYVGYGADPVWVVERVREQVAKGAIAVRGNHDAALVHGPRSSMHAQARLSIEWARGQLAAEHVEFLRGLPLTHELGELLFVHANAFLPEQWAYVEGRLEAARSLRATRRRITFCGHVHEPKLFHMSASGKTAEFMPVAGQAITLLESRRWLVIPGAAGQPRDGDPAACYASYDLGTNALTYWRVPYDTEAAVAKIRAANLPPALATRLGMGQ